MGQHHPKIVPSFKAKNKLIEDENTFKRFLREGTATRIAGQNNVLNYTGIVGSSEESRTNFIATISDPAKSRATGEELATITFTNSLNPEKKGGRYMMVRKPDFPETTFKPYNRSEALKRINFALDQFFRLPDSNPRIVNDKKTYLAEMKSLPKTEVSDESVEEQADSGKPKVKIGRRKSLEITEDTHRYEGFTFKHLQTKWGSLIYTLRNLQPSDVNINTTDKTATIQARGKLNANPKSKVGEIIIKFSNPRKTDDGLILDMLLEAENSHTKQRCFEFIYKAENPEIIPDYLFFKELIEIVNKLSDTVTTVDQVSPEALALDKLRDLPDIRRDKVEMARQKIANAEYDDRLLN